MKKKVCIAIYLLLLTLVLFACGKTAKSMSFKQDMYVLAPDSELTLDLKLRPSGAEYTLSVANPTIASVDGHKVKGLRDGITKITATSGEITATTTLVVTSNTSYTQGGASPEKIEYVTIYFVAEGSTFVPMQLAKGSVPGKPAAVYLGGYNMNGWYTDKEYTTLFDFNQKLYENVTLYGYWVQGEILFEYGTVDKGNVVTGFTYDIAYTEGILPLKNDNGESVTGVGAEAFKDKTGLKKVVIPASYTFIAQNAFSGCTALEEVVFEDGSLMNYIGVNAFSGCAKLNKLNLPDALSEIGGYAFYDCSSLDLASLPSKLSIISQYAFAKTAIKSVNLINVIQLLEGAFSECLSLNEVKNCGNITRCYRYAFKNTPAYLKGLTEGGAIKIDTLIVGCAANATVISVGASEATLVTDEAFYSRGESDLVLFLKGDPIGLGKDIFYSQKTSAIAVNEGKRENFVAACPSEYTSIICEKKDISDYTVLEYKKLNGELYYDIIKYFGDGVHLDLRDLNVTVRRLRSGAFYEADTVKTLTLSGVERIADQAVNSCDSLIAVILTGEDTVPILESTLSFQFSTLGSGACKIYVPDVKYNSYLTSWSVYSSRTYKKSILRDDGFAISVDENPVRAHLVQYVGDEEIVDAPNEFGGAPLTNIVTYAFAANPSVKRVNLPQNVKTIGNYAFYAAENLKCLFFNTDTPPSMGTYALHYVAEGFAVYVPEGKASAYIDASDFADYSDIIYDKSIIDGEGFAVSSENILVQYLGDETVINIPSGVLSIKRAVFFDAKDIVEITVPDSVTSISRGAFEGCESLVEITLPVLGDGRSSTGYLGFIFGAASYTDNLNKVPSGLKTVRFSPRYKELSVNGIFFNCKNIESIYFTSDTVVNYGSASVFDGTSETLKIYVPKELYAVYVERIGWKSIKDNIFEIQG